MRYFLHFFRLPHGATDNFGQVHSRKVALEWIDRLRELVSYWSQRHRTDTKTETDLLYDGTGQKITSPKAHWHCSYEDAPYGPPDPDKAAAGLGEFWHWCVLEGCRAILKSGRLFVKRALKGQYSYVLASYLTTRID